MNEGPNGGKKILYTGAGVSMGAAIGFIFGMLLLDDMILGAGAGAAIGLLIGAVIDAQQKKNDS